jgi:glyoxylase-like metal-dependent hydrolase (beta-lactamase superfamily II)
MTANPTNLAGKLRHYAAGITAIDADYVRPLVDAVHLVVDGGRAAFVDTGTTFSVPNLLGALALADLDPADVDWVLTTHVHLDHAGGAGALMRALPNARCVVHPRGARHLIEPAKLVAGSIVVYGEEQFRRLYGEIVPIPAERVHVPADGERIRLGGRELELIHTPGHALHHYCIVDREHAAIFPGDTFGLSYRDFDVDGREFVFPAAAPVHFDPETLCVSIDRLMSYRPRAMYLTHYGEIRDLERLASQLKDRVRAFAALGRRLANHPGRTALLRTEMFAMMSGWLAEHGWPGGAAERHRLLDADVEINSQGVEHWATNQ